MERKSSLRARINKVKYQRLYHFPVKPFTRLNKIDKGFHFRIAAEFDRAFSTLHDERTIEAYRQLAEEVNLQYDFLIASGLKIGAVQTNPYVNSSAMVKDVRCNGRLKVYAADLSHSLLTDMENFQFRVVHDYFGHATYGNQFGATGEENAWRTHCTMFTEKAILALTTETRGQNSWVNFGPQSHLPIAERPYAEQKSFILRKWARELY